MNQTGIIFEVNGINNPIETTNNWIKTDVKRYLKEVFVLDLKYWLGITSLNSFMLGISLFSIASAWPLRPENLILKFFKQEFSQIKIYFKNLRPEYKEKSIVKFRIVGRELYPTTSFATTPAELDVKYLPSASTEYEIRDAETEEVIVPFGSGSRVSCDTTGNFFRVQMDGLQAERNYRFCLKVVSGSGTTDEEINFYDDNYEFRVVR